MDDREVLGATYQQLKYNGARRLTLPSKDNEEILKIASMEAKTFGENDIILHA